ncbi:MAG: RHS repeat protein [Bdellovibrionaceae bacterium]|nr:RHS repeat protein [Pseudobdellovibrionaceae bacterium]
MNRWIALLTWMTASTSFALVDMKNANYTNSWTDLEVPGIGYEFKVVRAYNSRSLFNGMFGFGWCSDFETSMEIMPEGSVKITECGSGSSTTYSAREISRADIDKTISQIVAAMKKENKGALSEAYYKTLQTELTDKGEKRLELAKKYDISVPIKEGTKFFANGKEVEHVVFSKGFYTRNFVDGGSQRFNPDGKMSAHYDKNGNFLKFEYEGGLLRQIVDNNSRRLLFKYHPNKKVQMITGPNGLTSEYQFERLDDLSVVKNAWKNTYTYQYDEFHNLTKATWPDKSFISIKYDKTKDWVISFTDRDKCVETYKYELSDNDPRNHYWSTVKKVCGKETVADNRYEFWHKQRPDGQFFLQRVLSSVNGITTDIVYHDLFGKPISIRKNADRMSFDYYPDGLVKTKSTATSKMDFEYDALIKKVSQVNINFFDEKGKPNGKRVTQFKYDGRGNLSFAANSDGQKISMTYDNRGRIASITDQAKKIVRIEYEERFGKPAMVTRPGVGTIKVSYKPNGDIQNVESKEGPTVAMQVASTFNNLLDIIAPATAELYL